MYLWFDATISSLYSLLIFVLLFNPVSSFLMFNIFLKQFTEYFLLALSTNLHCFILLSSLTLKVPGTLKICAIVVAARSAFNIEDSSFNIGFNSWPIE